MLTSIFVGILGSGRSEDFQQVVIRDNCFGVMVHEFKKTTNNRYGYALFYLFRVYYRKGLNPIPSMVKALTIFYEQGCDCYTVVKNASLFYKNLMPNFRSFEKYRLLMERYYIPYQIGQKKITTK
jgi:hypothetical protein